MFSDTGALANEPPPPSVEGSVRIYALAAASHLWRLISEFTLQHPVREEALGTATVLCVAGTDASIPGTRFLHHVDLAVAPDVLHAGAYTLRAANRLKVYTSEPMYSVDFETISVYRLQERAPGGLVAKLLAVSRPARARRGNLKQTSMAGYALGGQLDQGTVWVGREEEEEGRVLGLAGALHAELSYNGGLLTMYPDRAVVSYYA
jgi:hypothetical protein